MARLAISEQMIDAVITLLPQDKETAIGAIEMWQEGKGFMPEAMQARFPRLATLWHSEAVRKALEGKVVIEAISDEQLNTIVE